MDLKLQRLIDHVAEQFSLENFYLKRTQIFKDSGTNGKTSYLLSMEWFPKDADTESHGNDLNPAGTVVIDMDIHTKLVKRIVLVRQKNFVKEGIFPVANHPEETIEWIEKITGLEFGRQFQLIPTDGSAMHFQAAVDNIPVYPTGTIHVEFNDEGKLSVFSIAGHFPTEEEINWEPFALTDQSIEPIVEGKIKLLEIPVEDEDKWKSIYSTTSFFITNDGFNIISFEVAEEQGAYVNKKLAIEWDEPINEPFHPVEIHVSREVSEEEALKGTNSKTVITKEDVEKVTIETRRFLQRVYQQDSGKWMLNCLRLKDKYLIAELIPTTYSNRVINRQLHIYIDSKTYEVLNYMDNNSLLEVFQEFKSASDPKLTKQEAYEKLQKHIEVTPVYVYDSAQNKYILCGKVDCPYGVDAVTAELIVL